MSLIGSLSAKLVFEAGRAASRQSNDGSTDAAFAEILEDSLLDANHRLRKIGREIDALPSLFSEELERQLRPIVDGLRNLNIAGRIDPFSGTSTLELFSELIEQVRSCHGDAKRKSLLQGFVGQFDQAAQVRLGHG